MPENLPTAPPEPTLEESEMLDESEELPGLEESLFDETPTTIEPEVLPQI